MFYTGLDPYTLKPVFVEKTAGGKSISYVRLSIDRCTATYV